MLQIRSEQIQSIRQELNLSFRKEVLGLLEENGYEAILNPDTNDIGIKDKSGNTAWLRYNQQVLPASFELPSGTAYQLNYYPDGGLQSVQMPNGNAIELFTKDGKLISLNHKGGASVSLQYTKDHKVKEIKVSKKKKYEFKYDKTYGYLNAIIDGNKQTKFFNHDNSGNLRQKIDAENRTTYFHYEVGENELRHIQYPDGSRETYQYDEGSNRLEITQRNNAWVKNYYDDNDNLRQVEWQDGSFILLEYDNEEEISSIQNEQSLINFRKDSGGEIIEEEGEFGSIKYEYNADEQLSKVIYPDKYEIKYSYDIDSELAEVKDSEGNIFEFTHYAKSSTSKISFGNGNVAYATREHFNGQIAETSLNIQNGNSYGQLYEYDDQERLSKISDTRSKFPSRTLHYDDADHLLAVKADKEKVVEQFTYDRSGQLTSANTKNVVIGAMEETKVYGENVLGYDSNGNLSDFLGVKATFRQNSTLDSIEAKGQKWHYQYDAFGRRISKSNGKETTQYVWAGIQLYEEIHITNGVETRQKYLYRPFEQRPFAIKNEKSVYLLQQDQRGAIIRAVDSFGELVWEAEYDAFGKAYTRTEKIHQPWRLQGQYFDAESDLHYNVGRYYSPTLKTYLSRDPRWYEVDASNYNYANNDPYNKADSLGAFWHIVGGAIVGAVIGGVVAYASGGDWRAGALGGAVTGAMIMANPALARWAFDAGSLVEDVADNIINDKPESIACVLANGVVDRVKSRVLGKLAAPLLNRGSALFKKFAAPLLKRGSGALKKVAENLKQKAYARLKNISSKFKPANRNDSWVKTSGNVRDILKEAKINRGNFGVGKGTTQESSIAGEAWVGKGYTIASDGKTLMSADKLRAYRPPSYKPKLGRKQSNFEWRVEPKGPFHGNGHLDIQD